MNADFGIPARYEEGAFAPVYEERTSWHLQVHGSIPPDLDGLYVRNGPNPPPVPYEGAYHWFVPDGVLHGVRIAGGRAVWYRNRWVRTDALAEKIDISAKLSPADHAYAPNTSNTAIVAHAGRLLSLAEYGLPYEVTPELETVGRHDFGGRMTSPMTAHPKLDPSTGEMFVIGDSPLSEHLHYYVIGPDGSVVRSELIPSGPSLKHDWAMTENHVLFFDLPVVFDLDHLAASGFPYRWSDEHRARIGVMPKTGGADDVRWFDIDPCYFVHAANAFEQSGTIVLDAPRFEYFMREPDPDVLRQDVRPTLHRWTLDLADGRACDQQLGERQFEFPQVSPDRAGRPYDFGYGVLADDGAEGSGIRGQFGSLVKWSISQGSEQVHPLDQGHVAAEGLFVPARDGNAEDEGWVLSYVYDPSRDASDLYIIDATDFTAQPQAVVHLPARVPLGFHGCWMPAEEISR
jgi:carotenoid cleavage dioxygenase